MNEVIVVRDAVAAALAAGTPVVALESTILAHGLPFPQNLELGRELEAAVRQLGAVPATIAVLGGRAVIGLGEEELGRLCSQGPGFRKAGATDLAVHLARKQDAATTVSATAVLAAHAGIAVFATGGIGGVHRGDSADVSHDLYALARTPIAVVSAGAKAILDLPRTVELLESLGVLVIGHQTSEFPAFYTRSSGIVLEHHCDDIPSIAAILHHHWRGLGGGGALVCNPIPPAQALDAAIIGAAIDQALADAMRSGIDGKALTPYLLTRLADITRGQSVIANRALAVHNATVAAQLATSLATMNRQEPR
jgi:pseudouridine-5'-phosphate glycosidase